MAYTREKGFADELMTTIRLLLKDLDRDDAAVQLKAAETLRMLHRASTFKPGQKKGAPSSLALSVTERRRAMLTYLEMGASVSRMDIKVREGWMKVLPEQMRRAFPDHAARLEDADIRSAFLAWDKREHGKWDTGKKVGAIRKLAQALDCDAKNLKTIMKKLADEEEIDQT
jgi:hypothetical protein